MLAGNRSQAIERLRAAARMLDVDSRTTVDEAEVLEVISVAVLLMGVQGQYGEVMPGEPVLFATYDAVEKFNDCREEED